MKKLILSITLLLILTLVLNANEFKVKSIKGEAKYKKGENWEKISNGTSLKISDQIKLENGAKIQLEHKTGKEVSVDKSGFYSVAKLSAKLKSGNSNVSKKLANSLLDELGDSDDMLASGNINDNMATLGAVERAFNNKFTSASIIASLPRSSYSMDNNMKFTWYPMEGTKSYKLFIKNGLDEVIFSKETSETELLVDLNQAKLAVDECSYWMIQSGDYTSEEFCIYRMSGEQSKTVKNELNSLKSELDLSNSMDNMILAKFYADNKIVNEATEFFEKAIEIDPEVDAYRVLYAKYLLSIGLNDEAMEVVKK